MSKHTRKKPKKPHPDFPLFPHATRRWAKKVRGKMHYFGPWADPQAALEKWLEQKDALLAGRAPRDTRDGVTVADACNTFLESRRQRMEAGDVSAQMFSAYFATAKRITTAFGRDHPLADLTPADFQRLRASLAKGRGAVSLSNEIQHVRTTFKYAFDSGLIDRPVLFGPDFRKPSARTMRHARHAAKPKMFTPGEIRKLLGKAGPALRAMILLGVNCGFGQKDCAELRTGLVDLDGAVVDFPRPKTGVHRRCPLWPETVKSLELAMKRRPSPHHEADADRVFLTQRGMPWLRGRLLEKDGKHTHSKIDAVRQEFDKLLDAAKLRQERRGFYSLRHTFRTIADEVPDRSAIDRMMGHEERSIGARYVERVEDERLRKVSEHVRRWLFASASKGKTKGRRRDVLARIGKAA